MNQGYSPEQVAEQGNDSTLSHGHASFSLLSALLDCCNQSPTSVQRRLMATVAFGRCITPFLLVAGCRLSLSI
jgi:hypothetical protein